ncbi:SpoIID/LytB domain-containing protein [uncultured Desulfobacter sp.]|uniref:SpoIID/LytB domain-containing protein n=1 Tax=uncultured Desulfobacter sp. TaxID=240139 RepID=UPI002AAA9F19|nr:SpoIID/LytB domain-containing protein [uncultured Desulfobacter sp.]
MLIVNLSLAFADTTDLSTQALEKEHLARYLMNQASYLIDSGKYFEALESYKTAAETTANDKTKIEALLSKATLLMSFLDAPEEALKVYQDLSKGETSTSEIAQYREGLLYFELKRYKEADATLRNYLKKYPSGRFRFQTEALAREVSKILKTGTEPVTPPSSDLKQAPQLRVRVCNTRGEALITGSSVCVHGQGCKPQWRLGISNGKLMINGVQSSADTVTFTGKNFLTIAEGNKKKQLRGELQAKIDKGKLLVINVLDIEDYLYSVVPSENPASWPLETLKAQAVAARTYAYYQLLHRKNWAYDLVDYAGDQAYGGMAKEHKRSSKAVDETRGMVLTYDNKPILAMFSANSGGYTADSKAVFDLQKPYLIARSDPASLHGSMASWTKKYPRVKIVAALSQRGINANGLESIQSVEKGPSGRIIKIRIVKKDGSTMVLRNRPTLRRALDLPEILFDIRKNEDIFVFEGHGWGHGVGYSQWGSAHMGKTKNFNEILAFYYNKAKIDKLW